MEGKLVVEDIENLDLDKEEHMEMTSTNSLDDSIGVLVLTLIRKELKALPRTGQPMVMSVVPKASGEHPPCAQNDRVEHLIKQIYDLLKATPMDLGWTSDGEIRIVHAEQNVSYDSPANRNVSELKSLESATWSPSVTPTKEVLQATKDKQWASLGKTRESRIGDQRGYKVIRYLVGGKTCSRGEDDTQSDYEQDQQGATQQQSQTSPDTDTLFTKENLPKNGFDKLREDRDLLLQEEEEEWGNPWIRVKEDPDSSGRASHASKRAELQCLPPEGITITQITSSPILDPSGGLERDLSSETSQEKRTESGLSWWHGSSPAYSLCNDDRIHCLKGFRILPKGFGLDVLELEEELSQKLSSCNKGGADSVIFSKAKKVFSNYCLCSPGDCRALALAREAVLRETVVADLQKKTLLGTMPSVHQRCTPTLQAMICQPTCRDFSPSFLQRALQKLKLMISPKKPPNPN